MLRALIVDDEGIERRGIAMIVKRLALPYEVQDAANGEEALALLRRERFDVLLTDIYMPFMDGLTLAHEARALYPELYIIILSAYADFQKAQQAMQENVYRYLLKPVNVLEFKEVMCEAANRIEQGRENSARMTWLEQEILRYRRQDAASQAPKPEAERACQPAEDAGEGDAERGEARRVSHAVELALEIIHREYATRLSLRDVAERVYLNPSYISSIFRRETGESFVRYLNSYRLDRAAEALRGTNRPVGEIRQAVGFTGDSYFIMLFRDRFGCTPQQYREGRENREDLP